MQLLFDTLQKLYGIRATSAEKVDRGFLSENYVITTADGKYFLKKYRFTDKQRVSSIHLVKQYFSDGSIPVVLPLKTNARDTFFLFEDSYYALFPFIADKQFEREVEENTIPERAVISMGKILGCIHLRGKQADLPVRNEFTPWNTQETLQKMNSIEEKIRDKSHLSDFDNTALKSIALKRRCVENNKITSADLNVSNDHLVHGDYLDQNVFFGVDDEVSYVFDFEKSGYAPRLHELFRSMMYSFLSYHISDTALRNAKKYLDAYASVYPVQKDEISTGVNLFYLKSMHNLWVESEHYLKGNSRVDELLYTDLHRNQYLSEHLEEFKDILMD